MPNLGEMSPVPLHSIQMELHAHFSNIHKVIIGHLEQAHFEIVAAVAWFTDRDIFEVLCKKSYLGVKVSVALIGDEINRGPGGLNFQKLEAAGGQVTFLPPGSRDEPTMHHKFCVADRLTVITGSYNWSQKARSNDENITVVTQSSDFAEKYLSTFNSLLSRVSKGTTVIADTDAVRRRLEMIRNLILLGEQEDISTHLHKLRPVARELRLCEIIIALDKGEYKAALVHIDGYLRNATALVVADYADIFRLRFLLETLEIRLESISDERADLERRLITFNRRHDDTLGDLIKRVLKARAELAWLMASNRKCSTRHEEAEAAAQYAQETFNDYAKQHDDLQREAPLPNLDEDTERELKKIYRKACNLCHPDKVTVDRKAAAHETFVSLQAAYKSNNLPKVKEIYETLVAGGLPVVRSSTLSEAEALRAAIAELEFAISKLVAELKVLQESDSVQLMDAAGATETAWQIFFQQQREALEEELGRIVSEILSTHTNE